MPPPDCTVLSWVRSLELPGLIVHVLYGGGSLAVYRASGSGSVRLLGIDVCTAGNLK